MSMKRNTKEYYLEKKYNLLEQLCIPITPAMREHIENLYPNTVAIENYCKSIIKEHLGSD